ncbi:MAG TPA: hypothetical protein VJ861_12460, partial [Treponemataceae bacterium]|nr:hypothetical protein [Treponemataceae bacterium]
MDEILLEQVTQAYYDLLKSIKWDDKVFMAGIREGLNKFLSNAIIRTKGGGGKYFQGDYYTEAAIKKLKNNDTTTEINYEHIIPKKKHIQEP